MLEAEPQFSPHLPLWITGRAQGQLLSLEFLQGGTNKGALSIPQASLAKKGELVRRQLHRQLALGETLPNGAAKALGRKRSRACLLCLDWKEGPAAKRGVRTGLQTCIPTDLALIPGSATY